MRDNPPPCPNLIRDVTAYVDGSWRLTESSRDTAVRVFGKLPRERAGARVDSAGTAPRPAMAWRVRAVR